MDAKTRARLEQLRRRPIWEIAEARQRRVMPKPLGRLDGLVEIPIRMLGAGQQRERTTAPPATNVHSGLKPSARTYEVKKVKDTTTSPSRTPATLESVTTRPDGTYLLLPEDYTHQPRLKPRFTHGRWLISTINPFPPSLRETTVDPTTGTLIPRTRVNLPKAFPLFSLPSEIRNQIYLAYFALHDSGYMHHQGQRQFLSDDEPPPICFVENAKLKKETRGLFFSTSIALLNIWPYTLQNAHAPTFDWIAGPGGLDDGTKMRAFGRIRLQSSLFDITIRQTPRSTPLPSSPELMVERLLLYYEFQNPENLAVEIVEGVQWIQERGGLTPRMARALVWYLVYVGIVSVTGCGKNINMNDFLLGKVKGLGKTTREVGRFLLMAW